jgi:hypothetical protein
MSQTTITYIDVELEVDYDYEPEEPATRDEPGCAHEAIINAVTVGGVNITDIIGADHLSRIADRVADAHLMMQTDDRGEYEYQQWKDSQHD